MFFQKYFLINVFWCIFWQKKIGQISYITVKGVMDGGTLVFPKIFSHKCILVHILAKKNRPNLLHYCKGSHGWWYFS